MTRLSPVAAAAAVVGFSSISSPTDAHVTQVYPLSRQESYGPRYEDWEDPLVKYCPHCYNARGPKHVKERSKANTDQIVLDQFGGGEDFPLNHGEFAPNGNYLETDEISVRHGVCGDPEQNASEGANKYSTATVNWPVFESFNSGQVLSIGIVMNAFHGGHCEFFVCNTDELNDPDGVPTQECFNKHPLTRAPDDGGASPIDPNYPGRYYVDPECRAGETEQGDNVVDGYNIRMRYVMPDIECEHCILQMVYYTGDTCKHVGYDEFEPPSWPGSCAPDKSKWIELDRDICGENGAYPEEFWACSDFSMSRDGNVPAPPRTTAEMPIEMPAEMSTYAAPLIAPEVRVLAVTEENSSSDEDLGEDPKNVPEGMPGTYEYLGCFKDSRGDRVLGDKLSLLEMTADICFEHCSTRGSAYMALQFGDECWCSRDGMLEYERHGDGAVCDYSCLGDENEPCGGEDAFDLFKLWLPEEPEDPEYVGCHHDDRRDRVLTYKVTMPGMTTAVCREYCSDKEALYYATQFSTECWCGASDIAADYDRHGPGNCYMGCDGEESVACGGFDSFSLFKYGDRERASPASPTPSNECEGDPVAVYEQCGGDMWTGSTCCEDGLECVMMGKKTCYSQCRPI